jgi:hypothetical protein
MLEPLCPRGACYFFLDKKVTKKSSRQIGFFSLLGRAAQVGRTHGLQALAAFARWACASGTDCYALPAAQPCTFCPLLAEADLLTVGTDFECRMFNFEFRGV